MDSDVDIAPQHVSGGSGRTLSRRPDGVDGADEAGGVRTAARVAIHALIAGLPVVVLGVVAIMLGPTITAALDDRAVAAWRAVFTAIVVQGVPFLLLGTVVSAAISAFVPAWVFTRVLPRNPALAVPVAGAAGVVPPGCECASVPVAGSLMRRGVAPAAAAQVRKARVHGPAAPPADTWVTVTGTWHPTGKLGTDDASPAPDVSTVERVPAPKDPYHDVVVTPDGR